MSLKQFFFFPCDEAHFSGHKKKKKKKTKFSFFFFCCCCCCWWSQKCVTNKKEKEKKKTKKEIREKWGACAESLKRIGACPVSEQVQSKNPTTLKSLLWPAPSPFISLLVVPLLFCFHLLFFFLSLSLSRLYNNNNIVRRLCRRVLLRFDSLLLIYSTGFDEEKHMPNALSLSHTHHQIGKTKEKL